MRSAEKEKKNRVEQQGNRNKITPFNGREVCGYEHKEKEKQNDGDGGVRTGTGTVRSARKQFRNREAFCAPRADDCQCDHEKQRCKQGEEKVSGREGEVQLGALCDIHKMIEEKRT